MFSLSLRERVSREAGWVRGPPLATFSLGAEKSVFPLPWERVSASWRTGEGPPPATCH